MSAATATVKTSLDIQPSLNAQGQPTGLDLNIGQSEATVALAIVSRRAYSFTLATAGNSQALAFGDITQGQILLVVATVAGVLTPVRIQSAVQADNGLDIWAGLLAWTIPVSAGHWFTSCLVTSTVNNTDVEVMLAG